MKPSYLSTLTADGEAVPKSLKRRGVFAPQSPKVLMK